jgi:ABC-2 type transport system permease protein
MAQGERLRDSEGTSRRGDPIGALVGWLPLSAPIRALIAKDLRYVTRDLTLLSQVSVPLILYAVPFVLAPEASHVGAGRPELLGLAAFSVGFIAYMMCSILGLSSVGLEGRAFWLLKTAPLTARQLIAAKWWMAFLPTTLLTLLLCLIACLALGAEPWAILVALCAIPVGCGALCGIEVGLSGIFPRFIFENPAHRASVAALIWGFVCATTYALIALVPLVALVFALTSQLPWLALGAVALFLTLSFCAGFFPLRLAAHRLETYAWES